MRYPRPWPAASDATVGGSVGPVGGSAVLVAGDGARVLLVDDDPVAQRAVRGLLAIAGLLVVGEAGDAHDGLVAVGRVAPTVVVAGLQVRRSGTFGALTLVHRLQVADPPVMVVVLTAVEDLQVYRAAYGAGAFAVVRKGASGAALVTAVHAAHVGTVAMRRHRIYGR
jgi:two-component system, NarL family, nitrate/nitrite response regulator NarL